MKKLVSILLTVSFIMTMFAIVPISANALPRPTQEECEAVGEQKIYFEFPDGTWGDWSNLKINKLNNTLPVYCNPYAVYGNEKEFFDPGWETKPGQCTYTGEGKTVFYDINSEMSINHYSEVDDKGKKVKLYYYRYMETEPGKDYGVLFSTTANGGFQTADVNMTADCLGDTVVLDDPIQTRENAANSAKSDYFAHWKNHSDLVTKANVLSTGKFAEGQFPLNQPKAQMLSNALKDYLTNFINVGYFQLESNQKIMEKLGVTPQEVYDQYMKDNADIINGGTVEPANPDKTDVDNGCPVDFIRYDKVKLNMDIEHKKLASPKEVRKVLGLPEEEPTTAAPTTEEPTEAPTTEAPTTVAPTTEAPTTEAPTTVAPTTEAPTTEAPTTVAHTTEAPTTEAPTTEEPTTAEPMTEPDYSNDIFVLAGSSNFIYNGWSPDPNTNRMTFDTDDGLYKVTVPNVTAEEGALYQVKVVQFVGGDPSNAVWHGMDGTDLNYDFMLTKDCDVTVTYNPQTGEINVYGDGVIPPVYNISYMTAVGAVQGNFLNGITWWDPAAAENRMTEVEPGVYEITYEDVDTNTDYQFKFAANGGWDMNWGFEYGLDPSTKAKLNEINAAGFNSGNINFEILSEADTATVTLVLDLRNWDMVHKGGANYQIIVDHPDTCFCSECGGLIITDYAVSPLCDKTGLTEGNHCSQCGKVYQKQEVVPAIGHHTPVVDEAKPATCTETGLTEGSHCSVCGEVFKAQEVIPAKGHTIVIDEGKTATCTEDGITEGSHCSVCGEIIKAQEVISAKGHTLVVDKGKPATCTEDGITTGSHCSVCGEVLTAQEKIPAKGHTAVVDEAKSATCTETGLTEGSHCSVCGEIIKAQEEIPLLGHKPVIDPAVPATCQHDGHTIGSHCENCGLVYVEPTVIPKLPHTVVIDEAVAPSCTETGLTEGSHCSVCGEVIKEQIVLPALNHSYEAVEGRPPTHYRTGLTDGIRCSRCSEWLIEQEVIPMLEPSFLMGDVNGDGKIDVSDATEIQKFLAELVELTPERKQAADTNADGKVDVSDATQIQKFLAELVDHLG